MLTPQQIQETGFERAVFGGYDMESVDEFLEPLTQDYITLYKENSVLKSKMRILVEKLEEYRRQETSMQNAILAAQKTSDQMIADAERKCAKLLRDAEETAALKAQNVDALAEGEKERLSAAQAASAQFIDGMEKRLRRQIELLDELRKKEFANLTPVQPDEAPAPAPEEPKRAFDFEKEPSEPTTQEKADALIEEIGLRIEESLGTATLGELAEEKPEAPEPEKEKEPKHEATHGELPPAKRKLFDELKFGRHDQKK